MMFQKNIKSLRFFHNKVKHSLLKQACIGLASSNKKRDLHVVLLDIGMGRGGDLLKWKKCGIRKVIGFDPNATSIEDAKKRLADVDTDGLDYTFHCCQDVTELNLDPASCSIVSCQFAIHYFFSDIDTLRNMLTNVKQLVKKNGYFVGTFMNADKINEVLVDDVYMNNAMMIRRVSRNDTRIGETIHVHLSGTLYFAEDCVSIEYMVYPDVLVRECERVGLRLVKMTSFESHFQDMGSVNHIHMDEDHKVCSFMYSSFVFANR